MPTSPAWRDVRKCLWAWWMEVTFYRHMMRCKVTLPGIKLCDESILLKLTSDINGQVAAAKALADSMCDSKYESGAGKHGFGQFAYCAATTNTSNKTHMDTLQVMPHACVCMHRNA